MKPSPEFHNQKRPDLQGLRGISIIVVVAFHFFPNIFPNGTLGVDQFFVLSGYLMCMLLKRCQSQPQNQHPSSLILNFYTRRFKRILPLYLLVILISLLALYNFFPESSIATNQRRAYQALSLMSNQQMTKIEIYFDLESISKDIFAHTWSLSVEFQYYFMAPLIFLIASSLSDRYQYVFNALIGVLSYSFFILSPPVVGFLHVFARVWQFVIGMITYLLSAPLSSGYEQLGDKNEKSVPKTLSVKYVILAFMILADIFPYRLPTIITRTLITLATGFLIFSPDNISLLSNRVLVYIGDISYSLYLTHWLIYSYWSLATNGTFYGKMIALIVSVIIAVISYELVEKWYLQWSTTTVAVVCGMLVLLNLGAIYKDVIQEKLGESDQLVISDNMTLESIQKVNRRWNIDYISNLYSPTCYYEEPDSPLGWCRHTGLEGKYKIALIGNSWAASHANLVYQECGKAARSIVQGAGYGCDPLYPSEECEENDFEERMREEKPDYGFVLSRFEAQPLNLEDDKIYQVMKNQTLALIKHIDKKLYILNSLPNAQGSANFEAARERYAQLIKDCGDKCELIDYKNVFFNSNGYQFSDQRGLAYFTTSNFLTPYGLERVRPIWREICEKL